MAFTLPNLPYEQNSLEPIISSNTINFHYGKHHNAYVTNLNNLIANSDLNDCSLEEIIKKTVNDVSKIGIFNNAAQVWNHTFYWNSLTPGGCEIPKELKKRIENDFGSFNNFKKEFLNDCITNFGSGWVWLVEDTNKLKIVKTTNANTPLTSSYNPLLTVDVWEHAYYLDYQNVRPKYVEEVFSILNWKFAQNNCK